MKKIIYGIQQVGVGVRDAEAAFRWYAQVLGADLLVFDDRKMATHMARYMGGEAREKRALLAMSQNGGGGYEIWQYTHREPQAPIHPIQIGDLGINYMTIKTHDISAAYQHLQSAGVVVKGALQPLPEGGKAFFFDDPYGNSIQVKASDSWFSKRFGFFGGVQGVGIGVSDIDQAKTFYADVLGYNKVIYDQELLIDEGGKSHKIRRTLLRMPAYPTGGFSHLLGTSEIELTQCLDREPQKIFADRYWGDLGYIHVCFDTRNIGALITECEEKGFPFRVKSGDTFEMGDTNGRWGYLEDADGTLIEFVEAQRVPLLKKLNWYIDLRHRDPHRPLPRWLIWAMAIKRVRF